MSKRPGSKPAKGKAKKDVSAEDTEVMAEKTKDTPTPATAEGEVAPEKTEEELKAERLANYRKAGEITREVKAFIEPQVVVGAKVLDLCEALENKIVELGGEPSFPANISINNKAAHYTASLKDESVIEDGDVVKVDYGGRIEGFLVDAAFTVNFSQDEVLKNIAVAPKEAVEEAVKLIKAGVKTNELGKVIEQTVKKYGYRPIQNLTGHLLEEWIIHGSKALPCVDRPHGEEMLEDEVWAVEVFASTGEGHVTSSGVGEIFQLDITSARVPIRNKFAKRILGMVIKNYRSLPFAKRWIAKEIKAYEFAMRELERTGKFSKFGVLQEKKGVYIGQYEQSVLVTKDGCE